MFNGLGSWFKKKLEETGGVAQGVGRQLNPFDGGATYSNPRPQPQPQQRPQPSFGQNFNQAANIATNPFASALHFGAKTAVNQTIPGVGVSLREIGQQVPNALRTIDRRVATPFNAGLSRQGVDLPTNAASTVAKVATLGQYNDAINERKALSQGIIQDGLTKIGTPQRDQSIASRAGGYGAGTVDLVTSTVTGGEAGKIVHGLLKAGLSLKGAQGISQIAQFNPALAKSLSSAALNPEATSRGAKYGLKAAQIGGEALGFSVNQGLLQGQDPSEIAKNIALNAGFDAGGRIAIKGAVVGSKAAYQAYKNSDILSNQDGFIGGVSGTGYSKAEAKGRVFPGADGQPRYEFSDKKAKVQDIGVARLQAGQTVSIKEVLKHPELEKNYPTFYGGGTGGVRVNFDPSINAKALFNPNTNTITVNPTVINLKTRQGKETLIHELTHAKQVYEGHATGTTPEAVARAAKSPELRKTEDFLNANKERFDVVTANYKKGLLTKAQYESEPLVDNYRVMLERQKRLARNEPIENGHAGYRANAGEQESEIAAGRSNMSQWQLNRNPIEVLPGKLTNSPAMAGSTDLMAAARNTPQPKSPNDGRFIKTSQQPQRYQKTLNVNDPDDATYIARIFDESKVKQFQSGDFSHFRGGDKDYYQDILKANLVNEPTSKVDAATPDYAMTHRPREDGSRAFDLTEAKDEYGEHMIPKDMYDTWYGSRGSKEDLESIAALKAIKGKPDAEITIYRASPKDGLNEGDWVTLSKSYAKMHADSNGVKVHAHKVKARDLKWAMDDVNEFGYFPDKTPPNNLMASALDPEDPIATAAKAGDIEGMMKAIQEPKDTLIDGDNLVGKRIVANDRGNKGKITAVNEDGSLSVRFLNKNNRLEATVKMRADQVKLRGGQPIVKNADGTVQAKPKDMGLDEVTYSDSTKEAKAKDRISDFIKDARQKAFNRYAPIEDLVKGKDLKPSDNPATLLKRFSGGMSIANHKIDNQLTPIVRQTKDFDGLRKFLIAERSNELADRGISNRADKALSELRNKVGEQEYGNFQKIAQQLYSYQRSQLDELYSLGGLSKDAHTKITKANQKYIPFNRVMDDLEQQGFVSQANNVNVRGNNIKAIQGSERNIIDPLESVIRNTYDMTRTIEKQRVLKSLVKIGEFEKIATKPGFEPKVPHISVLENGNRTFYKTDKAIADAMSGINDEHLNLAVRIASVPAKILRAGATGLNVGFAVPNVIRDQLTSAVNSKYGGVPIYDFVSGLASVIKKDDSYQRWLLSGADQASFFSQDRTTLHKTVQDVTGKGKILEKAEQLIESPLELLRLAGEFSEKGTRVGTFKRAVKGAQKEGLTGQDVDLAAMVQSRESSVDFARRGSKMKAANALIPFLNARTQGALKLIDSAKTRPVQTLAIGGALAGIPAAILYAHNSQYPEYSELPDYIKDEHFIIMTGDKDIPFYKIPKGEIGKIFGNPVEAFMDYAYQKEGKNPTELAKNLADALSPISSVGDMIPTAAKVPLELIANYDTFRDRNIVSPFKKDLPAELQYDDKTSETAKAVARVAGVSPAKLEHGFRGVTAGVGKQATQLSDALFFNKTPAQADMPVLDRFIGEGKDLSKSTQELYKQEEKLKQERALENYNIKESAKKGDTSMLDSIEDNRRKSSLERSIEEDKIEDSLTPQQRTLFRASEEQRKKLVSHNPKLTKDANLVAALKDSLSTDKDLKRKDPKKYYEQELAKYEKEKADLSLVQRFSKEQELGRLGIKSNYSADVQALYDMSKANRNAILVANPSLQGLMGDVWKLSDELAGRKFTNGSKIAKAAKGRKGRKVSIKIARTRMPSVKIGRAPSAKIKKVSYKAAKVNRIKVA